MLITVILMAIYYFGWAKSRFQGPRVMGADETLSEIEREFEHAAETIAS